MIDILRKQTTRAQISRHIRDQCHYCLCLDTTATSNFSPLKLVLAVEKGGGGGGVVVNPEKRFSCD